MNLKQLECSVQVADLGSFSRAALFLSMPQPVLSRYVRQLEMDLRQTLLIRTARRHSERSGEALSLACPWHPSPSSAREEVEESPGHARWADSHRIPAHSGARADSAVGYRIPSAVSEGAAQNYRGIVDPSSRLVGSRAFGRGPD